MRLETGNVGTLCFHFCCEPKTVPKTKSIIFLGATIDVGPQNCHHLMLSDFMNSLALSEI